MARWFKKLKLKNIGAIVLIIYLSVSLISAQFELMTKKQQLAALEEQEQRLILENQDIKRLLEEEDEASYVERIARERLGYAHPEEKIYIDIQSE